MDEKLISNGKTYCLSIATSIVNQLLSGGKNENTTGV
jgi:GH18 family chitinase